MVELAQQFDSNLETDDIDEWMTADTDDVGHHLLSDEDIVGEGMNTNEVEAEEEHVVDKEDEVNGIPTPGEEQDMVEKCLLWYERQEESTSTSLLLLKTDKRFGCY